MAGAPQSLNPELALRGLRAVRPRDRFAPGLATAVALHTAFAAAILGWAWFTHKGQSWGDSSATNGAIQATMTNSLPLPPRQPTNPDNVLATEAPSPAPVAPKPRTVEVPRPDAIPIPVTRTQEARPHRGKIHTSAPAAPAARKARAPQSPHR